MKRHFDGLLVSSTGSSTLQLVDSNIFPRGAANLVASGPGNTLKDSSSFLQYDTLGNMVFVLVYNQSAFNAKDILVYDVESGLFITKITMPAGIYASSLTWVPETNELWCIEANKFRFFKISVTHVPGDNTLNTYTVVGPFNVLDTSGNPIGNGLNGGAGGFYQRLAYDAFRDNIILTTSAGSLHQIKRIPPNLGVPTTLQNYINQIHVVDVPSGGATSNADCDGLLYCPGNHNIYIIQSNFNNEIQPQSLIRVVVNVDKTFTVTRLKTLQATVFGDSTISYDSVSGKLYITLGASDLTARLYSYNIATNALVEIFPPLEYNVINRWGYFGSAVSIDTVGRKGYAVDREKSNCITINLDDDTYIITPFINYQNFQPLPKAVSAVFVPNLVGASQAVFKADKYFVCSGQTITFTDLSTGDYDPTKNAWTFPGGSPSTGTGVGPFTVTFPASDPAVHLVIKDSGNVSLSEVFTQVHIVSAPALSSALVSANNQFLYINPTDPIFSSGTSTFDGWYLNGILLTNPATGIKYGMAAMVPISAPGTYLYKVRTFSSNSGDTIGCLTSSPSVIITAACKDPSATNYDPNAVFTDNTLCVYPTSVPVPPLSCPNPLFEKIEEAVEYGKRLAIKIGDCIIVNEENGIDMMCDKLKMGLLIEMIEQINAYTPFGENVPGTGRYMYQDLRITSLQTHSPSYIFTITGVNNSTGLNTVLATYKIETTDIPASIVRLVSIINAKGVIEGYSARQIKGDTVRIYAPEFTDTAKFSFTFSVSGGTSSWVAGAKTAGKAQEIANSACLKDIDILAQISKIYTF